VRSLLCLTMALTAATPAMAQSWTQTIGSDGKIYDVLLLNSPGNTDPLILLARSEHRPDLVFQ
jgi:hypothetical protein